MIELIKNSKNECKIYALIVAGGRGLRMQSQIRKQYIEIAGEPILAHTLRQFATFALISHIVLVVPEDDISYCVDKIVLHYNFENKVSIVSGGAERQQSVRNGLKKVKEIAAAHGTSATERDDDKVLNIVLIHDGVRPFTDHDIIERTIKGALDYRACIPVVPVSDTLKRKDKDGFVSEVVDRKNLYKVQTPQAFELDLIIEAHENALFAKISATDDASLVEQMGKKVFMIQGSESNIKITTQEDLLFAEYMASLPLKK